MKIIYFMWLRELKRYFRSKSRIVGSLGQPLLFLLALGFGLGPALKHSGMGNYFLFLVPGIVGMTILFSAIFSGIQIIWDRQFGFLKETLVAPVSRLNLMIGRTLGGATVATIQGAIVLFISMGFGFRPGSWWLFPVALVFMLLVALLFTALGTGIASVLEDMQGFQLIMNFLVMPIFFLSGALFPLSGLPPILKWFTIVDPLSYGIDSFRALLVGAAHFGLGLDFTVLAVVTAAFLVAGSYLFSRIQV